MLGYHLRWYEEPLVAELVEHEFEMPLVNPLSGRSSRTFVLRGKIDALVRCGQTDRQYLVEHKTTSQDISEGSAYWQKLRMDGQVSTYYAAFPDAAGCIYDVIRRPGQRRYKATPEPARTYTKGKICKTCKGKPWPIAKVIESNNETITTFDCPACHGSLFEELPRLHAHQRAEDESLEDFRVRIRTAIAESPDDYYKRGVVVRLDSEIREHQLDVWHQANMMRELANEGLYPRNPDACIQFNRPCEYFDVCTGVASIDDDRLFQVRVPHPELRKEAP